MSNIRPPLPTTISCDILDEGNRFIISAYMPGVSKNEVRLNVTEDSVEISAQHIEEENEKKKNYLRKELKEVSYYRILTLPDKVISSKTKAKLNDGILKIEIPKIIPDPKPKTSQIKVD